ncbi:MAG: replicative DNA helicase [Acidobacteria bacterium]|nr:replicative DNA helicase [Acidobacteriota bacterium]
MSRVTEPLPVNIDAERSVLGAIVNDPSGSAYNQAAILLTPDDFSLDSNRRIFRRMIEMVDRNCPVDLVTLAEELAHHDELELVGGAGYISSLTDGEPRLSNIEHYARIVKEKAALRRLVRVGDAITSDALDATEDTDTKIGRATERILDIANETIQQGPLSLEEIFKADYGSLDGIVERERIKPGVSTGFRQLDTLTSGLQPSDLIIIAGRPSMGKTALALSLARHVGLLLRLPVLICSLEMSKRALFTRMVCMEARLNSHRLRGGNLSREEWARFTTAISKLTSAPIFIDDTPGLNLAALRARARRIKQEHGLALLIVDYIQLMTPPKAENRNQEISVLSRSLKIAAKELEVPLVALSQLSRAPEMHGRRPQLSDLRDSGSLEQDADVVAFLFREEYYLRMANQPVPMDVAGMAELTIAKQRNGPTGTVPLIFMKEFASFGNFLDRGNEVRGENEVLKICRSLPANVTAGGR